MTWDPINVNIYWVHLRWVQNPCPQDREEAEWAENEEESFSEYWLTYTMALKAMERMQAAHLDTETYWWDGEIMLTHPDTHNPQSRLFSINADGERHF